MFNSYTILILSYLLSILIIHEAKLEELEYCELSEEYSENNKKCGNIYQKDLSRKRYILYDVNPPEGFNLRRDVYVRVIVFVKKLIEQDKEYDWNLVLPPWGNLYHWRSRDIGAQTQLPWGLFFDIPSLQKFAPVIEMYQFFEEYPSENGKIQLDHLYILQNDEEMFKTGKFENKNKVVDCNPIKKSKNKNKYDPYFWGYSNVTSKDIKCIIFHGTMSGLQANLDPKLNRAVMFDHMEIPLHDFYGSKDFWSARRSMRYNIELYKIAKEFRVKYLNSTDINDKTERPIDWTKEKKKRNAIGGPYLAVHLRRRDFTVGRANSIPTVKNAAFQLKKKMDKYTLKLLFVATDAEEYEFAELKTHLSEYSVINYVPPDYVKNKFKDGGVAIIDQIICSYARYFIGTHESTFTFRIQEEREIIGFPPETTFNQLCKSEDKCTAGGRWEIVW